MNGFAAQVALSAIGFQYCPPLRIQMCRSDNFDVSKSFLRDSQSRAVKYCDTANLYSIIAFCFGNKMTNSGCELYSLPCIAGSQKHVYFAYGSLSLCVWDIMIGFGGK